MRGSGHIDFDEQVELYGPFGDVALPTTGRIHEYGRRRTDTLSVIVCEVIEEWQRLQQTSAIILRSRGPELNFADMREIHRQLKILRG